MIKYRVHFNTNTSSTKIAGIATMLENEITIKNDLVQEQ